MICETQLHPVDETSVGFAFGEIYLSVGHAGVKDTTIYIRGDQPVFTAHEGIFAPVSHDVCWCIEFPVSKLGDLPETAGHSIQSWACYVARQVLFGAVIVTSATLPEFVEAVERAVLRGARFSPGDLQHLFTQRMLLEDEGELS